ncbi:acyl-CoA N-acyltransferase [Mycotypha africana]|uniref:acyl-CoA N-acyltransferase n=1 Tax=Mycotypha africana TaxID=64632 RepID=UPI0023018640|nr:acyl-CoA N-acyltransferase [Mycotypha africana]KAI8973670.1 acyl-CoA N-acyltransferase [Mycotypha africana]
MTESDITIQLATAADAHILSDLARRTFSDTFGADNPPEEMEKCLNENYTYELQLKEINDPSMSTFMAIDKNNVAVGFAQLRLSKEVYDFIGDNDAIELQRIYVDKNCKGKGVGKALLLASIEKAKQLDKKTVWLGVWEHNPKAIAFYERFGFTKVGSHIFRVGDKEDTDYVFIKKI